MLKIMLLTMLVVGTLAASSLALAQEQIPEEELLGADFDLANVVPPLFPMGEEKELPIVVRPIEEHVRRWLPQPPGGKALAVCFDSSMGRLHVLGEDSIDCALTPEGNWKQASIHHDPDKSVHIAVTPAGKSEQVEAKGPVFSKQLRFEMGHGPGAIMYAMPEGITVLANAGSWCGTDSGLYSLEGLHPSYGVDGPLATRVTGLALDSKGVLWAGTPLGLSRRDPDGSWSHLRGRDGLPVEDITCLAIDGKDRLWIGTKRGVVHYRPYEDGRQWFYRAGPRYVPGNDIVDIAVPWEGDVVYVVTDKGVGAIDIRKTTLLDRARTIERRVNERHRRWGMVADCQLDDADNPTSHHIGDNDNDGLWTAYHVAAMSLCYGATGDEAAKESAKTGMHALYMLQNASGTPGLVARSVVPLEVDKSNDPQWRLTPDGKRYWKSDTSSDEIDGHYLAFYTYWEHIARHDPQERELLIKQIGALTDYIVGNGYVLIDWDGKRTTWGFWSPELLNGSPRHYIENGLNSLQILSFLKVAHHVTGDSAYKDHYRKLIVEHGYLDNVLLSKKCFPDENNHSDDQLGFVAWYPILQLEKDPKVRGALHAGVRRHYLIVEPEQPSFYVFAYATIDPRHADIEGGIENLRQIPTDRRQWPTINGQRDDVIWDPRPNRFEDPVLTHVLPADERPFAKWNGDPYEPDRGGDGRREDDGAAYLLPYWMARYHGFIAEKAE